MTSNKFQALFGRCHIRKTCNFKILLEKKISKENVGARGTTIQPCPFILIKPFPGIPGSTGTK